MKAKLLQSDERFRVWEYGHLTVVLDRKEVYPDDPGQGTPALVYYKRGDRQNEHCSTYWCATGERELLHHKHGGTYTLSQTQLAWLDSLDGELTDFLYRGGK